MSNLLPVAEAQARLLAANPPVSAETLPITQAIGRWAAAPIAAQRTQPAHDLSAMDGYALRFDDLPGPWQVIGESAAGKPFAGEVNPGEAVRIFTGAVMPTGADTVLVQEEAQRDGERLILSGEGPSKRTGNVRRRGLDFSEGDTLVSAGERLTPARLAVAATGGAYEITVRRRVRVAIAATGDELVDPGAALVANALPESNRLLLRALLADLPIEVIDLGILPDRLDVLTDAFAKVEADLLVTTGGASVGDHDLVQPALRAAGANIDFWRVALRPGKPLMAGRRGDMAVLGLPGNPVSAFVTTILFVKPLIAHLAGAADPFPISTHAVLGETIPANGPRTDYMRAELRDGRAFVASIQDSSMLLTLARAGCLIVRPPHDPARERGDSAEILMIA
ncbi:MULTISPECIES: molybdopterin molybdotransferase MoeA [unclassified Sphingomonas]|uniref:molybdopterin molybdotransferase MoeA n=1 Tax=unclassified Sphingomonas TaxID=196159 RepID=UPI001D0F9A73|nr:MULTISPECIES: molybdopterin molybdotransferase MoeA [unclassified Sphingomonas]MCC2979663.1 molybdopterin molybdotransferase MoeA [Sphingomonas sp. IC4-52]MCD2315107.1 molybdopterin molybdotransferase MoeA [Sphingomonas sp. IC-11]